MPRLPVKRDEVFVEDCRVLNARYNLHHYVKKWLKLPEKCAECGQGSEWHGRPLKLQVDHINGVGNDNRLENLRLLCPNCHSQTRTFCGRNKKKE